MRISLAVMLAMAVAAPSTIEAAGNQPSSSVGTLQRCLSAKANDNDFVGVISISHRNQPVATVVRGNLAGAGTAPISTRTRFNLASMSKMFTAVAVAQLIDAGRVGLDVPVGTYVAGLTHEASSVSVRELLTHSAGLGNFFRPENLDAIRSARTASDLLPLIAADKPAFPPGSRFDYSNSGFALLGILVERVSGSTYGDYLRRHVFDPVAMKDTGLDPKPIDTLAIGMTAGPDALSGHGPNGGANGIVLMGPDAKPPASSGAAPPSGGPVMALQGSAGGFSPNAARPSLTPAPGYDAYGSPAGGMFSTADDLQRFAVALTANKLMSAAVTAAFTSKEIVSLPAGEAHPERDYGFGFGVGDKDGHRWFGHNGGTLGVNTEFAVFPDEQLVLTVLSSRDPPSATVMFSYARDLVLHPDQQAACATE